MKNTFFHILTFSVPLILTAQTPKSWEIGGGIGIGIFEGDLQELQANPRILSVNTSLSVQLRQNLNNNFASSYGMLYTGLSGSDQNYSASDWRQDRAFSFKGSLFELSFKGEIYPFGMYTKGKGRRKGQRSTRQNVTPYLAVGIGGAIFKPQNNWNLASQGGSSDPGPIQIDMERASRSAISIPMELGVRFRISNKFTLGLAGAMRYTTSDYLDGVSLAGNVETKDWFFTFQSVASYSFGKVSKQTRRPKKANEETLLQDRDQDGVADDQDECPDVVGQSGLKGCPDADRDGVTDAYDLCPEIAGLLPLSGCPDRDKDGVADKDDTCPDIKGEIAYGGCPAVDRDKDGVSDAEDLCPDMKGQPRWKGCPDSDTDGIPDNKDGCPGIPGPDKFRGCPDTDDDGLPDKEDDCPTIAGLLSKKGCPEGMSNSPCLSYKAIYYHSTLEDWQATSLITMDEIVSILTADPLLFANIEGHTDNSGREPANDLLAEKRAQKCRDNLVSKGIAIGRLNFIGLGSKKPALPNDTPVNRQLNRRVEIHFYKK